MTDDGSTPTMAGGEHLVAEAPHRLTYRLLTGTDDRRFCERVSAALADGYVLHGAPAITCRDGEVVVAQAVVLLDAGR